MSRAVACEALSPMPDCIIITITDTKKIKNKLGGFCCPSKLMPHFGDGSRSPGQKVKSPQALNSQESHSQLPPSIILSSTERNPEPPKQWVSPTCIPTPTCHPHSTRPVPTSCAGGGMGTASVPTPAESRPHTSHHYDQP